MDPLSHALLGASISYALLGGKLGPRAAAIGAVAALLPDVDSFVSSKEDPLLYLEYHRFITHSLIVAPIGALVASLPWAIPRSLRPNWKLHWLAALPAYLSHCFLDACTTYGTQISWPFSRERVGWDFVSVVDPVFTIGVALLLTIALRKQRAPLAFFAVAFAASYLSLGALQRSRAAEAQRELAAKRGHTIERSEVMPTFGNQLVWRSLYLADGKLHSDRVRVGWFSSPAVREGTSLPVLSSGDLTDAERPVEEATRGVARFGWFAGGWLARAPNDPSLIGDMRYSISTRAFDPVWGIRLTNGDQGPRIEWVNRQKERRPDMGELWSEITGRHPKYRPEG